MQRVEDWTGAFRTWIFGRSTPQRGTADADNDLASSPVRPKVEQLKVLALFQDPEVPAQAGSDFGNTTQLHPVGLAALGFLIVLAILVPRRLTPVPLVLLLCFIPAGQRLVIATIDFTFLRVLMVAIWLRLFLRSDLRPIVWNHLDRFMVLWTAVSVVTGTLLGATLTIFINRMGYAVDGLMVYFFFRMIIRDFRDLAFIATAFMLSSLAVVVFFVIESRTSKNMFHVFGGVPEFTEERGGRLRCQGAFAHSILAGCFWACLVPFYFARGWIAKRWMLVALGVPTALAIVRLCASSTPIMAVFFGIVAGCAWFARGALRWFRWLIFAWLCVLHFFLMEQPVWHLLARIDFVGGSTGWHRYHLVDKFFDRFYEWWLVGTMRTGHWGPGLHDVTNQFVAEGVTGGIWRLGLFALTIFFAFAGISRSLRLPAGGRVYKLVAWCLGVALFQHCMNFIGVSYFEQIVTSYLMVLATISSLTLVPGARVEQQLESMGTWTR